MIDKKLRDRVTVTTLHTLARSIIEKNNGSRSLPLREYVRVMAPPWDGVIWSDTLAFRPDLDSEIFTRAEHRLKRIGRITDRPCQFPTAEPADVPTTRPADDRSTPCSARQAIIPSSHAMPVMPPPPRTRACPGSGEHVRR